MFIEKIGLDETIEASSYVKSLENNKLTHRYENSMQALRHQRGKVLCDKIKSLSTKTQRNNYALTLSQYAIEDVITAYQFEKSLKKMDEFIKIL